MPSRSNDYAHLADDDAAAPWMTDQIYGGMQPSARRRSWMAARQRATLHAVENLPPGDEDYEPPYDIPETSQEPDFDSAAPIAPTTVSAADWPQDEPPAISWIVRDKIPRGDVSTLDGDGGLGKTIAALQLGAAVVRGRADWLGFEILSQGKVVFLSAEEPEAEMHRRTWRIATAGSFAMSELEALRFWFPDDLTGCLMAGIERNGSILPTPLFESLSKSLEALEPVLIVVDNVAAIYGGEQNHRGQVRAFMNLWRALARKTGAAILLLNHPSLDGLKSGTGRGGSMDWRNAVRCALHLKPADDKGDADRGVRIIECVKNNYAPRGTPVRLEWERGLLVPEGATPSHERAAQDAAADAKFMELVDLFTGLGLEVSPSSGRNYAPALFEKNEHSGGYRRGAFAKAMQRLLEAGTVVVASVGPASRQKKILQRTG